MASEPRHSVQPDPIGLKADEHRDSRRWMIKTGAMLVPAIMTLRATPAWAQTDYTVTAYRYGVGAGLCKNPDYNPNAAEHSTAGQEFVPCPEGNAIASPTVEGTADTSGDESRGLDRGPRRF